MADGADDEKKKDEGIGLLGMFAVSVLGSLTVFGIIEGVKYVARRSATRQPMLYSDGGFAGYGPGRELVDGGWEFVE